jgi:dipeptidyl aminopeptidase/acylaminoacyl peptidase
MKDTPLRVSVAPFGSWKSPITAPLLTASGVSLSQVSWSDGCVWWVEGRPAEEGRSVLVCCRPGAKPRDAIPRRFNCRTRVHEYGGGAYCVHDSVVFFSNYEDQRLWRLARGSALEPLTPEPSAPGALRYADGRVTPDGSGVVCVREHHQPNGEVVNEIVLVPAQPGGTLFPLAGGADFYAAPRLDPKGERLAWLVWDHPLMPWDGCELWTAEFRADGTLRGAQRVAGGPTESIFQPEWSPEGVLHFVSDRSGWWNLYALDGGEVRPLAPMEAEFGAAHWVFGLSRHAFLAGGRIACVYSHDGVEHLGLIEPGSPRVKEIDVPFTSFGRGGELRSDGKDTLVFVGGSPSRSTAVVSLRLAGLEVNEMKRALEFDVDPGYLSSPESLEFPTEGGRSAHALYYAPANKDFHGPPGEKPPLLVVSHGGPTSATSSELNMAVQFWTSRGFAVADVNYGGSTGYGRAYREQLLGNWGIVDAADCIHAARCLAENGKVDAHRMAVRGGSAGGYTTLCALVFHDVFAAGASYYGVADLEALAHHTHKFEARYLDGLVGPYPQAASVYRARSPIHHTSRLSCPVIIFQGLEDKVVPPAQARALVAALRAKGLPYAYVPFPDEQHGFRRAENIRCSLEAELYFYSRVFGFQPADAVEPIRIENFPDEGVI